MDPLIKKYRTQILKMCSIFICKILLRGRKEERYSYANNKERNYTKTI